MSCSEGVNSSINNLVGGNTGKITSCFKTGRKCSGCSENHGALDVIATNIGRPPITTPQAGTVSFASFVGGYGNRVHVNHGGVKSSYSHMSGIAVSMGQSVAAGDQVGTMGNTGGNYAVHLHYENHEGGMKVNPCGKLGISC
ncbi:MAG: hypothetical protein COY40_06040 [Alphaproteobacteria bacterium CG_4_10_14_0_8_um_filter_53_9]|nr:MAG: hypothetical protein COY40_06040 [Alphaproteobacteria bacterium CG_4_10_14_0_8_um_filter_53_9]